MKAYVELGLHVQKVLVRVKFLVFPKGCQERKFWEVYQLIDRVSCHVILCVSTEDIIKVLAVRC